MNTGAAQAGVWCVVIALILFLPIGTGLTLSFALLILFYSFATVTKSSRAFRLGKWLSRSVLTALGNRGQVQHQTNDYQTDVSVTQPAGVSGTKHDQMSTKLALGLIVLTAIATYELSHVRRHHFEPTKLGNGSILIDTETGVECSARIGMKWTDEDQKAVQAAESRRAKPDADEDLATAFCANPHNQAVLNRCEDLLEAAHDADEKYYAAVDKANAEEVPEPNTSYFKGFPLCKDIR